MSAHSYILFFRPFLAETGFVLIRSYGFQRIQDRLFFIRLHKHFYFQGLVLLEEKKNCESEELECMEKLLPKDCRPANEVFEDSVTSK